MKIDKEKMIIAVDFDATLSFCHEPTIGEPNKPLIDALIKARKKGDKIILWTCRDGSPLACAVAWCKMYGLEFDAINDDLTEIKKSPIAKGKSNKIYADVYIDNKAFNPVDKKFVNKIKKILR